MVRRFGLIRVQLNKLLLNVWIGDYSHVFWYEKNSAFTQSLRINYWWKFSFAKSTTSRPVSDYRLYGLTTLFAFIWLVMYLDRTVQVSRVRKMTVGALFMFVLLISFGGQVISTYDAARKNPAVVTDEKGQVTYNVVTNDTYYDFLQKKTDYTGRADYAPINAVDHDYRNTQGIIDHQALVRSGAGLQKETLNPVKTTPSMLRYNVKALAGNTVDVPVMIYGNEVVRINGKRVSTTRSERGTLLVKLPENARRLTVAFGTPTWVYPLWILAVVTLVGTLVYLVKSGRKERSEDAR